MSRLRAFFKAIGDGIARVFWSLLGLDDRQQRALFSWALTGAIIALSLGGVWLVDRIIELVPLGASAGDVANILGDTLKLVIILMGLMTGGVVLIARGGEMKIKGPGGIEITAAGPAVTRELAKSADVAAMTTPTEDDPKP